MTDVGKNNKGSTSADIAIITGTIIFLIGLIGLSYMLFIFKPKIKNLVKEANNEYKKTLQMAKSASSGSPRVEQGNQGFKE